MFDCFFRISDVRFLHKNLVMKLSYYSYSLPFKYPFSTARGTKTHQPTLIVELDHFGIKGYGEAPAIAYYDVTVESMIAELESKRALIERYALQEPERFWHFLHHLFPKNNFLVCALDMAGWDIYGQIKQQPLYKVWGLDTANNTRTDYTIGMDSVEKMVEKLQANPWPIYKVKMGWPDDMEMVRALRRVTDAPMRVDVNSGWSLADAELKIPQLRELNIELVEEPVARFDYETMKRLYPQSVLPLMADESCVYETDVERCAGCFHGINIKLTKCGGITPARRMIEKARSLNMKVMIGCMNESTVGSAAIAHLLPLLDYVDMDGPLLLAEDVAEGIGIVNGVIKYSEKPGLGITFKGN
jgi:L-Ala-D/L-Glu epimerase